MNGHRNNSSPSRPRPVPNSNGNAPDWSTSESTPRATSTARLASPVSSLAGQGTPPVRQVPTPAQLQSGNHTPLAGAAAEDSHSVPGPGQSALAAALQGSLGRSPPRFGTPPVRPLSPGTAGAALQGSGPQTTYGSFESRSGQAFGRRPSGIPSEDPKIVKRHLVQPSNLDGVTDNKENASFLSNRSTGADSPGGPRPNLVTGVGEDEFSSLRLQGGDVTREMYRWAQEAESPTQGGRAKRSKSWHISRTDSDSETPDAGTINVPGGFRRDYLRRLASPPPQDQETSIRGKPGQKTRKDPSRNIYTGSFYEFLTIHGHFAGEYLAEDDEDDYGAYTPEDYEGGERGGEEDHFG